MSWNNTRYLNQDQKRNAFIIHRRCMKGHVHYFDHYEKFLDNISVIKISSHCPSSHTKLLSVE